jgi:hypothetical protein
MTVPTTRAGWLQFLKEHGQEDGGVSNFAAILGTYPSKIKEAVDPLVLASYVTMTGKRGIGGGFKYSLTSLGHRYLNENQDELTEGNQADSEQSVREAEPKRPPQRHRVVPLPNETVMIPRQKSVPPHESAESPSTEQEQQTQTRRSDVSADPMHAALYELLYERFGAEISAKDLVERMERREAGDAA